MNYHSTVPDCKVKVFNWEELDSAKAPVKNPVAVRGTKQTPEGLYLENILSCQFSKTKGSSGTVQFSIPYDNYDYSRILLPGMWFALYMKNGLIDLKTATNKPEDGFRTIGVIQRVAEAEVLGSDGRLTRGWQISAKDWGCVYEQQLYLNPAALGASNSLGDLIVNFNLLFMADGSLNKAENYTPDFNVETIHNAVLAVGNHIYAKKDGDSLKRVQLKRALSPSKPMLVPLPVVELLGKKGIQFSPGLADSEYKLTDIIRLSTGIQKYDSAAKTGKFTPEAKLPRETISGFKYRGARALSGTLANQAVWTLLSSFANLGLNEIFADMKLVERLDGTYGLAPMLVLRQIPFNTANHKVINGIQRRDDKFFGGVERIFDREIAKVDADAFEAGKLRGPVRELPAQFESQSGLGIEVTPFHTLPRTKISKHQILSRNVGKSLEELINFVQVFPTSVTGQAAATSMSSNFELNEVSIRRHGIRPFVWSSEYADPHAGIGGASVELVTIWTQILADCYLNNHLWESGSFECIGINDYIGVGDNIEVVEDGMIYHLESYSLTFGFSSEGQRTFRTSLHVSHGQTVSGEANIAASGTDDSVLTESKSTRYNY